ncbi:MAG: cyclic nucleotide-binding domain-containing protein [Ignavibacteriales bacterium]|nr:cyclic nucleotide-binding domain-containing protein [Ignavibacteriales bacterium]
MVDTKEDVTKLPGKKKYYRIGETIVREGEPSEGWFVLLNGRVGVVKKDLSITEFGESGTVFGELGSFLKIPRTATLQAIEPTSLLYVNMSLEDLVLNHPDIARKIILSLAERVAHTTDAWWTTSQEFRP